MKSYIKPLISIVECNNCQMICSSSYETRSNYRCDSDCKIWHICQDRCYFRTCYDKQYR